LPTGVLSGYLFFMSARDLGPHGQNWTQPSMAIKTYQLTGSPRSQSISLPHPLLRITDSAATAPDVCRPRPRNLPFLVQTPESAIACDRSLISSHADTSRSVAAVHGYLLTTYTHTELCSDTRSSGRLACIDHHVTLKCP